MKTNSALHQPDRGCIADQPQQPRRSVTAQPTHDQPPPKSDPLRTPSPTPTLTPTLPNPSTLSDLPASPHHSSFIIPPTSPFQPRPSTPSSPPSPTSIASRLQSLVAHAATAKPPGHARSPWLFAANSFLTFRAPPSAAPSAARTAPSPTPANASSPPKEIPAPAPTSPVSANSSTKNFHPTLHNAVRAKSLHRSFSKILTIPSVRASTGHHA